VALPDVCISVSNWPFLFVEPFDDLPISFVLWGATKKMEKMKKVRSLLGVTAIPCASRRTTRSLTARLSPILCRNPT